MNKRNAKIGDILVMNGTGCSTADKGDLVRVYSVKDSIYFKPIGATRKNDYCFDHDNELEPAYKIISNEY